jgi:hypothetical protein
MEAHRVARGQGSHVGNIKLVLEETDCEGVKCIYLARERVDQLYQLYSDQLRIQSSPESGITYCYQES